MFSKFVFFPVNRVLRGPVPYLWLLCLVLLFLAGCGGNGPMIETQIIPYTSEQATARAEAIGASYRIRPGDYLTVAFKYEDNLDQKNILVLPDGYISMVGVDNVVKVAGMTLPELDGHLTSEYGKDYKNPDLSVIISEISKPEIYVLGMVENPGLYKMPYNGMGVLQAVALAGGFNDSASKSNTVIMRATDEGFMIRTVDFSHIEYTGFSGLANFDIQPYDVIYVPRSAIGDFAYYTNAVFGSALNITRFFWDVYALANMDKIDRIVR